MMILCYKVTLLKRKNKIYMINNFHNVPKWEERTHLQLAESTDGKTFKKLISIDDDNERFFYPHAFFDEEEQMLYVAYENAKQHYLKNYTFEELGI